MKRIPLTYRFVEYVPDETEDGIIYVSIVFATGVRKCCCGCGHEVVTPLSATDWRLIFDGKTVSPHPSVGNRSLECRSHYWIRQRRVRWAEEWSQERIESARRRDQTARKRFYENYVSVDANTTDRKTRRRTITSGGGWRNGYHDGANYGGYG